MNGHLPTNDNKDKQSDELNIHIPHEDRHKTCKKHGGTGFKLCPNNMHFQKICNCVKKYEEQTNNYNISPKYIGAHGGLSKRNESSYRFYDD